MYGKLHTHFTNTQHEWLFIGTFADRCKTTSLIPFPNTLIWDPIDVGKSRERAVGRTIYTTLVKTLTIANAIMHSVDASIRYELMLYIDMHIPLVIEINTQIETNKRIYENNGTLSSIWNKLATPYFDENKRFNYSKMSVLTDTHFLTEYNGEAIIQKLHPSIDLFDGNHGIFHEGMLQDVLTELSCCSFFTDKRPDNPICHLLSKALPQRCTIRNLKDILSKYVREHDSCYIFVLGCMKASLLGAYKNSVVRPPFLKRVRLIETFQTLTKAMMLSFINNDHQQLLFFTLKEFTIFGVSKLPAILSQLQRHYHWVEFKKSVKKAMNIVRTYKQFDYVDPLAFKNIESIFASINKSQVHHLFRPHRNSFSKTILQECDRQDDAMSLSFVTKFFPSSHHDLMWDLASRYEEEEKSIPISWLEYFNVRKETISALSHIQDNYLYEGSKTSLKGFLKSLDRLEFESIRAFADVFDRKQNFRMYTLPAHIYILQVKAIRMKFKIKNGQPLNATHGTALICLHCKTFKSFVNHVVSDTLTKNLHAHGHRKVLVDDDTMKLYCGKRSEKVSDGKKKACPIDGLDDVTTGRVQKRNAKEMRKEIKNKLCSQTELKGINLIGRLLQFYNTLYTVCPSCGNFMEYNKHFLRDTFYCGGCLSKSGELYSKISCAFCRLSKKNENWVPVACMDAGEKTSINLCSNCYKPWIQTSEPLEKNTIFKGLQDKWKKLQHPSNL